MDLAYKEAEKGYLLKEVPVGAIVVDNTTNSIISSAYNQVTKQKNSTKHAEMLLIEKGCKKKNLINPQWLRNIKNRKYPLYRIDTLFSEKKYIS